MADQDRSTPAEDPQFETGTVRASRAREQGLGLGGREIAAQRDPGGVQTPTVEPGSEAEGTEELSETLDQTLGVQGAREDSQVIPPPGDGPDRG